MNEPPDYKKSIFKHNASKVEVYGKKMTREQLREQKLIAEEEAEIRKRKKEMQEKRNAERAK